MTFGRPSSIAKGTEPTATYRDVQGETAFQDQAGRKVAFCVFIFCYYVITTFLPYTYTHWLQVYDAHFGQRIGKPVYF